MLIINTRTFPIHQTSYHRISYCTSLGSISEKTENLWLSIGIFDQIGKERKTQKINRHTFYLNEVDVFAKFEIIHII